ncbi:hypothetical protein, partial [Streptomyces sp. P17]|uniref:hypothetical protein n=1 Tax=Streptomyces sp. P17 TaxID=3074716 RepID=UPI0028F3E620
MHPQYLISGRSQSGYVNLRRDTAAAALKKARELLQEDHLDVRISTPRAFAQGIRSTRDIAAQACLPFHDVPA